MEEEFTAEDEAAEDAAFEAGFNATDIEPVAQQEEPPPQEAPQGVVEPAVEPEVEPEVPQQPALTIDSLKEMIDSERTENQKLRDRLFGKVGELQQRIDSIRANASLSPKARERLQNDFPELAEMLFDPADAHVVQQPAPKQAPEQPAAEDISRSFELRLLKRDHPDWSTVVQSEEFVSWRDTVLPPETSSELQSSWDADFISGKLNEFKEWRKQLTQKQQQTQQQANNRQNRLDLAVAPQGIPRTPATSYSEDDEEAAMVKAFGRK